MSKNKTVIRIVNPLPNAASYTTLRRANSFVSRGVAVWKGSSLYFPGNKALETTLQIEKFRETLRTMDEAGYDGLGQMRLDQIQGLPLAGPAQKLIQKGSKRLRVPAPRCHLLKHIVIGS